MEKDDQNLAKKISKDLAEMFEREYMAQFADVLKEVEEGYYPPDDEDDIIDFLNKAGLYTQAQKLKKKSLVKKYREAQNGDADSESEIFE